MDLIHDTVERYRNLYGSDPDVVTTAPGRVNLIGEHTDYNDGFVLPIAIDRTIIVACGKRADRTIACHSVDLQSSYSASLESLEYNQKHLWTNYPVGVAWAFLDTNHPLGGMNLCIRGTIPIGAGLSSSGALEIACAGAYASVNGLAIPPIDLITIARMAETKFVGVQCGIMDQFVSMMGKKDHALFLDCRTLEYHHVPFPRGVRLIVGDTGLRRELARSAYNQREAECDDAVRHLSASFADVKSLRDISTDQFQSVEAKLPALLRKRARHVITENQRVLKTIDAMKKNDLKLIGLLMTESHRSLRDNFEVSCEELDAFVYVANGTSGVFGARMTGAGFGGSGICIVEDTMVDDLVDHLRVEYPRLTGRSLTVYLSSPDDGAAVYHGTEGYRRRDLAHPS